MQRAVGSEEAAGQQIQRMPGVRTAVDVAADRLPATQNEPAQRPVPLPEREGAHRAGLELRETAHDPLEIEGLRIRVAHDESRASMCRRMSHTIASPGSASRKLAT